MICRFMNYQTVFPDLNPEAIMTKQFYCIIYKEIVTEREVLSVSHNVQDRIIFVIFQPLFHIFQRSSLRWKSDIDDHLPVRHVVAGLEIWKFIVFLGTSPWQPPGIKIAQGVGILLLKVFRGAGIRQGPGFCK